MKIAIMTIVLLFGASLTFGQTSKIPGYKISASKSAVTVTFKGKAHRLNIHERIDAARIRETELLFANEKGGFRYLVLTVSGDSRDGDYDRQCGAGTESNLIWVKLDATWKTLDVQAARYESCWSVESLNGDFNVTKDSLHIEYSTKDDKLAKLTYNANEPEKGFQIAEVPFES